ncbi:MAG: response regulator transcription factor [Gemmatimonadetes bacterium]|nr:response regulator transcription factor [Gemmatimonadota bacterium]
MIRVFVADDHPVVRAGLRQFVAGKPSLRLVGEAADGDELVAKLASIDADVLLLDVTMPGAPFPELLHHLQAHYPALRVLVLSVHPEDQYAVRCLRDGAAGYLTKDRSPEELLGAIERVARGEKYVSPSLAQRLAAALAAGDPPVPHEALSRREYQVMCLLGAGKTVTEVAAELTRSPKTVSTHRANILRKMRLRTNADLIRYALQHGLTE